MFKSKVRPIAIPQSEHQHLAGTLALLWGNADFERPPIALGSLVAGVGLHDRAYPPFDALAIGELPEDEWLELTRRGFFEQGWDDPAADLIARMHLRRLVGYGDSPARQALVDEMSRAIDEQAARHGLDRAMFERIDRITNLCDSIAFDFCFEAPAEGMVPIFPHPARGEERTVRYRIFAGTIRVEPWPFAVDRHAGYLVGYRLAGYPEQRQPVVVQYQLVR